jgi:hypothetical protein
MAGSQAAGFAQPLAVLPMTSPIGGRRIQDEDLGRRLSHPQLMLG